MPKGRYCCEMALKLCRSISEFRAAIAGFRAAGEDVGLVTTMGALHAGHISLVAAAKARHARVVATIFVNPTQFGDASDLDKYPRNEAADLAMFAAAGVDVVLIPTVDEMYPTGDETIVETTNLANIFHGLVRPGHYRGVATVVTKLLNIATPDAAYFGEKDYQQLAVIKRMVRDLHMPFEVVGVPTMREADGLAMSSRNARLTAADRAAAPVLNRALDAAEMQTSVPEIKTVIQDIIATEPRATLIGLDIVDAATFAPISDQFSAPIGIMLSVQFGDVLLIDQREISL